MKFNRSSGHKKIWLNDRDCDSRTAVERKWKNNVTIPWIAKYSGKQSSKHFIIHQKYAKNCVLIKKKSALSIFPNIVDPFSSCEFIQKWFLWLFFMLPHTKSGSIERRKGQPKPKIEWKKNVQSTENSEKKRLMRFFF